MIKAADRIAALNKNFCLCEIYNRKVLQYYTARATSHYTNFRAKLSTPFIRKNFIFLQLYHSKSYNNFTFTNLFHSREKIILLILLLLQKCAKFLVYANIHRVKFFINAQIFTQKISDLQYKIFPAKSV